MLGRRHELPDQPGRSGRFADRPGNFAGSMDALSEILSGVRLTGAVYFHAEFSAPWGVSAPASKKLSEAIAPGEEHLLVYHLLLEGAAVVELLDGQSTELRAGDIVILAHGDAHHISSGKAATRPFPNYGI